MMEREVGVGGVKDLAFVTQLQKLWSNNVGFLPRAALLRYLEREQIVLVRRNNQPAGYLIFSVTQKGLVRLIQVAIDPELLRSTMGTKVMQFVERGAIRGGCSAIRLSSRGDLPANLFWPEVGFRPTATYYRCSSRGLPIIEWTKSLVEQGPPPAFSTRARRRKRAYKPGCSPCVVLCDVAEAVDHELLQTCGATGGR